MIGLSVSMAWSAEYPFTGRTIATQLYRNMTPRLPDSHQIFPFRTGRQAWAIIQTSFFIIEFTCNFRCFLVNLLAAVAGLAEVFMPGQTVIAILL
jgi:hypothetical protein